MTTLDIVPKRYVRRADSGLIANTAWLGAMAQTAEDLKSAPWREAESAVADTSLPVNNPATFLAADDRYVCAGGPGPDRLDPAPVRAAQGTPASAALLEIRDADTDGDGVSDGHEYIQSGGAGNWLGIMPQ